MTAADKLRLVALVGILTIVGLVSTLAVAGVVMDRITVNDAVRLAITLVTGPLVILGLLVGQLATRNRP